MINRHIRAILHLRVMYFQEATNFSRGHVWIWPVDTERISGYRIGGVSPLGQKKRLRCFIDASAVSLPFMVVNGGRRGLQIKVAPADLAEALGATVAAIAA